jgi:hypothetical protein
MLQIHTDPAALSYFRQLLDNPNVNSDKAKRMVKALYPNVSEETLMWVEAARLGKSKSIRLNPRVLSGAKKINKKINKKILVLMNEGYPHEQAVAIAYSMLAPEESFHLKSNPRKLTNYERVGRHLADKFFRFTNHHTAFLVNPVFKDSDILSFDFEDSDEKLFHKDVKEFIDDALNYLENHTVIVGEEDHRQWKSHIDIGNHGGKARLFFTLTKQY